MKMTFLILKWTGIIILSLIVLLMGIYFLGPRPKLEAIDNQPSSAFKGKSLAELEAFIQQKETQTKNLKADNQARILWNDSIPQQTEYVLLYLHGFSASPMESAPLHINLARRYGMNVYLSRIEEHGLRDPDALGKLTPKRYLESAKEAVAIAREMGKKIILMSCSTGSTLALYLAANDPDIHSLILLSPNIAIADPNAKLLAGPWAKKIVRAVYGGAYKPSSCQTPQEKKYWACSYHVDALIHLQVLIKQTMKKEIFAQVTQPTFLSYYYKDKEHQDETVSVDAMKKMFSELGTSEKEKMELPLPNAATHVIGSQWHSKELPVLEKAIFQFMEELLQLDVVE